MVWITPYILTFFLGSNNSEIFLYVYFFHVLCNVIALSSNACWICSSLHEDVLGKTTDDVWLKMGETGDILAELWEVSVQSGDELTLFGVSFRSRDAAKDLQLADELCCLEVPAFWKKSIPQFSSNVKHFKLIEKYINIFFCRPPTHIKTHKTSSCQTVLNAVLKTHVCILPLSRATRAHLKVISMRN